MVRCLRALIGSFRAPTEAVSSNDLTRRARVDSTGGLSPRAWSGIAYSTLLAIVVAYILWNNAVRVVGSGRTAIFNSMIPLVAMLVAWPLLGEHPRPVQIGGAVLIVSGVLLSRRAAPATRPAAPLPGR